MRRKLPGFFSIFLPLLLLLLGLDLLWTERTGEENPAEAQQEPEIHWLSGQVLACSSQSFLLLDAEGHARSFPLPETAGDQLEPGCRVDFGYVEEAGKQRILQFHSAPLSRREVVERLLKDMSTEEKVGQLFLARCPAQDGAAWVEKLQLGGYILFDRDFRKHEPEDVRADIAAYQQAAKTPLFIAVDEEGGQVVRASSYAAFRESPFSSPQSLYAQGSWEAIEEDTREKCSFLQELGINLNLAPVADVSTDPQDFIYKRSFGQDGSQTAQYVSTVVKIMQTHSMGSALKHFPGYGGNTDTHKGAAYDQRPYEHFLEADFLPFQAGISAGATMVMVSHNTISCLDAERPASLSPAVLAVLREELGFQGIIITDDLAMEAATGWQGEYPAAVQAILAGCDMLCSSDFATQYQQILTAVEQGRISPERLDASVKRILLAKQELGLLK